MFKEIYKNMALLYASFNLQALVLAKLALVALIIYQCVCTGLHELDHLSKGGMYDK